MIITGVILIIPMVFVKPVTTAGFSGFIQSIWGFLAVVIITVLLEMLKSLVINPKAILGFEKLQNDKRSFRQTVQMAFSVITFSAIIETAKR